MAEKGAVFVKIENYKDLTEIVNLMKDRLGQARALLEKAHQLTAKETAELEGWSKEVEEVTELVSAVDSALPAPEAP